MGITKGIFTVDTHTHAQRYAVKFQEKGVKPDYAVLTDTMSESVCYDNSPRMLYFMDRYDVNMCIIQPSFSMTNEVNMEIVKNHPGRFAALCNDEKTMRRARDGIKPWNLKDSLAEIEELLATGMFVGIGEGTPGGGGKSWEERFETICAYMELIRKYKVVAHYHTGCPSGYAGGGWQSRTMGHFENPHANPLLCHEVASAFPDVPIVMQHGGIEGSGYYMDWYNKCLNVAASHENVYLETGQWWAELYEKPLKDPNIGCEKLLWGTDWGASCTAQTWMPGCVPETYVNQDISLGPPSHQIDIWGWSLRELGRLNIPQDDLNLILGGNAVRLYKLKTPHTRLFKEYLKKKPKIWYEDKPEKV